MEDIANLLVSSRISEYSEYRYDETHIQGWKECNVPAKVLVITDINFTYYYFNYFVFIYCQYVL